MKRLIYFFIFLITFVPVNAEIITGEIEYNAENSGGINISYPLTAKNNLSNRYIDTNNQENLNYLFKGITELKDRKIAEFSDGSYGILYYNDPMFTWYYSNNGRLINFSQKDSEEYPCKVTKYKPDGTIANRGYRISEKESYIYTSDGKLIAHWIGENCYDAHNNLIMKRKVYK